jgi:uncharacterized protein HemY
MNLSNIYFDSYYLQELCKLIIYIAENSRIHQTKEYVYQNKYWKDSLQNIMMNGWNATLSENYIKDLRKNLGLKLKTNSKIAYHVFLELNDELFKKCKNGDYTYLMLDKQYKKPPKLPHINRYSWETGLMMKMNNNQKLIKNFNEMINNLPNTKIKFDDYKILFFKYFDKKNWDKDIIDILYFLESLNFIHLNHNTDGSIKHIIKKRDKIRKIKNFNNEIIQEWNRPFLEDFYHYITKLTNK